MLATVPEAVWNAVLDERDAISTVRFIQDKCGLGLKMAHTLRGQCRAALGMPNPYSGAPTEGR